MEILSLNVKGAKFLKNPPGPKKEKNPPGPKKEKNPPGPKEEKNPLEQKKRAKSTGTKKKKNPPGPKKEKNPPGPKEGKNQKKMKEFQDVSQNFPILCLSETMSKKRPGVIEGYDLAVWRPAYKRTGGGGRFSGGLAVYHKLENDDTVVQIKKFRHKECKVCFEIKQRGLSCGSKCTLCKKIGSTDEQNCLGRWLSSSERQSDKANCTCANCNWVPENNWECYCHYDEVCRFCRFYLPFKLTYNDEDIIVCLVYFPPYDAGSKKGYDEDFIHMVLDRTISTTTEVPFRVLDKVLETFNTKNVIVIGDMNANTKTWNLSHERKSKDESPIDHFGQRLLNLCRERKLEILNGCTTPDSEGELTKGRNVYDYALVHTEKFPKYDFRVLNIGLDQSFFDHRPIVVKIGKYEKKDEEKDNQARAAEGDVANLAKGVEGLNI